MDSNPTKVRFLVTTHAKSKPPRKNLREGKPREILSLRGSHRTVPGDSDLEQTSRKGARGGGGEISPMKTVQPGFLAMAAGSERRRRKRDRGKEDELSS